MDALALLAVQNTERRPIEAEGARSAQLGQKHPRKDSHSAQQEGE
jgi:hypothetical protein